MQLPDLASMPLAERLAAMEVLWESLSRDPAHDPSPTWHADVLAQRRGELERCDTLAWDDVKAKLRTLADTKHH